MVEYSYPWWEIVFHRVAPLPHGAKKLSTVEIVSTVKKHMFNKESKGAAFGRAPQGRETPLWLFTVLNMCVARWKMISTVDNYFPPWNTIIQCGKQFSTMDNYSPPWKTIMHCRKLHSTLAEFHALPIGHI